jgi:hypothetical protein
LATTTGYFAGGFTATSPTNRTDKLTFSTDTTVSATTANLSVARRHASGVSEGETKGYLAGGDSTSSNTTGIVTTADKVTFSSDTTAAQTSANLSSARYYAAGLTEGSTKGYFIGGVTDENTIPIIIVKTADKITFSSDTTAAQTSADLPEKYGSHAACAWAGSTKGYYFGGYSLDTLGFTLLVISDARKYTFSTDSQSAQSSANLSVARIGMGACSEGSTKCYAAGGDSGAIVATADKTIFSTDTTTAATTANLTTARYFLAGTSDGGSKGFFCGGNSGTYTSIADKLVFSTDATTAATTANLSLSREGLAALGADSGGYSAPPTPVAGISLLHFGVGI